MTDQIEIKVLAFATDNDLPKIDTHVTVNDKIYVVTAQEKYNPGHFKSHFGEITVAGPLLYVPVGTDTPEVYFAGSMEEYRTKHTRNAKDKVEYAFSENANDCYGKSLPQQVVDVGEKLEEKRVEIRNIEDEIETKESEIETLKEELKEAWEDAEDLLTELKSSTKALCREGAK